jgi:hypothetical protein
VVDQKKSHGFDGVWKHRKWKGKIDHPDVERLREMGTPDNDFEAALRKHEIVANCRKEEKRAAAHRQEKRFSAIGREEENKVQELKERPKDPEA